MKVLVIIPAYNEQESIINLVNELKKNVKNIDYIVINDASTDNTKKILRLNNIIHINLPINMGLTGATRVGIEYAYNHKYDYAIKIDGDGQHDTKAINYMLTTMINHDADVVQMSRFMTKRRSFFELRMWGSWLITLCIFLISGKYLTDPTNGCHLYNKEIIKEYHYDINLGPEPDTLLYLIKNNYKFKEIEYAVRERTSGKSMFSSAIKIILYMLEMCVSILFIIPFRPKRHKKS